VGPDCHAFGADHACSRGKLRRNCRTVLARAGEGLPRRRHLGSGDPLFVGFGHVHSTPD
jgi:hypothetical protein